jgi:hypothetical protein
MLPRDVLYVDTLVDNKQLNVKSGNIFNTNRSIKAWSENMTSKYNSFPKE